MPAFHPTAATPLLLLMGLVATVGLHQRAPPDTHFIQKLFTPAGLAHRVRAAIDAGAHGHQR